MDEKLELNEVLKIIEANSAEQLAKEYAEWYAAAIGAQRDTPSIRNQPFVINNRILQLVPIKNTIKYVLCVFYQCWTIPNSFKGEDRGTDIVGFSAMGSHTRSKR